MISSKHRASYEDAAAQQELAEVIGAEAAGLLAHGTRQHQVDLRSATMISAATR